MLGDCHENPFDVLVKEEAFYWGFLAMTMQLLFIIAGVSLAV
jgi:hypothetical protein